LTRRTDLTAALFLEKVSPALEHVDSSSGAIGNTVNRASEELVPVIAAAPADLARRSTWLERLWEAYTADQISRSPQISVEHICR
jgi:hypothetical protein